MKITTPQDLELARQRIAATEGGAVRVGTGYDVHRLAPDRALVLGIAAHAVALLSRAE